MATFIKQSTTIGDAFKTPELSTYEKYLMYQPKDEDKSKTSEEEAAPSINHLPLTALKRLGWSPKGIADGLNFFIGELEKYAVEQYFVYGRIECDTLDKREVNLIRLKPEVIDPLKPAIVLAAGGAYNTVCTMVESLPTARHFVDGGYQVFLLTYRVSGEAAPKAIADIARAIKYMIMHKDILNIDPDNIVLGGFSAGANAVCNYGVPELGYGAYKLPKPKAILSVYTFIDLKALLIKDMQNPVLINMFGKDFIREILKYNICDKIGEGFPPAYIICGYDDVTVGPRNSELLHEALDRHQIPSMLEIPKHAPHGFGDGTETDAEGWPERAMEFLELLQ